MSAVALRVTTDEGLLMVEVSPTRPAARVPVDICAVVDVSGSMGAEANMKDERGVEIKDGLTVLDVVKHALRTIAHSLGESDSFSLVEFSTVARVVLSAVAMGAEGKATALTGIDSLRPDGQTNLWDGISLGLDALRSVEDASRVQACLLLTDGQPNVVPPTGHIPMLRRKMKSTEHSVPVHTFGFGREVESVLLDEIAEETGGLYAYIPDASLVGSVFISTLANLFTTLATAATLRLESEGRVAEIKMGMLHQEQTRAVVLATSEANVTRVTLQYGSTVIHAPPPISGSESRLRAENARQKAADTIRQCVALGRTNRLLEAQSAVRSAVLDADVDPGLLFDLQGQVTEAVSTSANFQRWGQHYLPSLAGAHARQVSNNCKDPGVQVYGGPVFRRLREDCEDIFCKLPPPTPSYVLRTAVRPVDMSVYIDHSGSCFEGGGLLAMHDGTRKRVDLVRAGDVVLGGHTVVCVVRTETQCTLTRIGTLLITDWHPMRVDQEWVFPCTVGATRAAASAVYNFVLDDGHEVTIEGTVCVTLGHGFAGPVVSHDYFGTEKVVLDLRAMRGWSTGYVSLAGLLRNASGLACGLLESAS